MAGTLYVTDLDGTLLRGDMTLGDETVEIINRFIASGGLFTYATARSYATANGLVARLNLKLPAITFNGTFVVDAATGRWLRACILDTETVRRVLAALDDAGHSPIVYAHIDGRDRFSWLHARESEGTRGYVLARPDDARARPVADADRLLDGQVEYMSLIGTHAEARSGADALRAVPGIRLHLTEDTYVPGEYWLEISRDDTGKDAALRYLRDLLGVDRVVAFGDNLNDLPLFAEADEGYAVANAFPALKEAATGIIGANDADGVARFLAERMK